MTGFRDFEETPQTIAEMSKSKKQRFNEAAAEALRTPRSNEGLAADAVIAALAAKLPEALPRGVVLLGSSDNKPQSTGGLIIGRG